MPEYFSEINQRLGTRILSLVYEQEFGFVKHGKSSSMGGEHDRELLISLRRRSELIVTTAKTAEIEGYIQPKRPLILLTTRKNGAEWLEAKRLELDDPEFSKLLQAKKTLFETGLRISKELFERKFIEQVVVHHDQKKFPKSALTGMEVVNSSQHKFYDRFISIFERRGS